MKLKNIVKLLAVTGLLVLVAGCSSKKEGNGKKGEEAGAVTIVRPSFQDVRPPANEMWMWKEYEKMSGVKVNFKELTDIGEKKTVLLTGKDLPEAFFQVGWSSNELLKYGEQGTFIPLEELIDEHAPNIKKIFEERPDVRRAVTAADGHIYALPYVDPYTNGSRSVKTWINGKWLEKLGLEKPTNLDEFQEVLLAFVNDDPNGNGKKDEFGWYMPSHDTGWLDNFLMPAYGMGGGGFQAHFGNYYIDKDDQLQLKMTDDKYKEVLKYQKMMYETGTLHKQAFSGAEFDQWTAAGANDQVGAWTAGGNDLIGNEVKNDFIPIFTLKGPDGDEGATLAAEAINTSAFVLTNVAKDPAKLMTWIDYFYGEEGSEFGHIGKEGETFNVKDGKKVYIDEILNYKDGVQLGSLQYVDMVYGGGHPTLEVSPEVKYEARNLPIPEFDANMPLPDVLIAQLPGTAEEANELAPIITDITKYADQMKVDFVTGKADIDKMWDEYIATMKKMGSDRYLEILRTQYDRYKSN